MPRDAGSAALREHVRASASRVSRARHGCRVGKAAAPPKSATGVLLRPRAPPPREPAAAPAPAPAPASAPASAPAQAQAAAPAPAVAFHRPALHLIVRQAQQVTKGGGGGGRYSPRSLRSAGGRFVNEWMGREALGDIARNTSHIEAYVRSCRVPVIPTFGIDAAKAGNASARAAEAAAVATEAIGPGKQAKAVADVRAAQEKAKKDAEQRSPRSAATRHNAMRMLEAAQRVRQEREQEARMQEAAAVAAARARGQERSPAKKKKARPGSAPAPAPAPAPAAVAVQRAVAFEAARSRLSSELATELETRAFRHEQDMAHRFEAFAFDDVARETPTAFRAMRISRLDARRRRLRGDFAAISALFDVLQEVVSARSKLSEPEKRVLRRLRVLADKVVPLDAAVFAALVADTTDEDLESYTVQAMMGKLREASGTEPRAYAAMLRARGIKPPAAAKVNVRVVERLGSRWVKKLGRRASQQVAERLEGLRGS